MCDLLADPPHRLTRAPAVAWFGLFIASSAERRGGLGRAALKHLESVARREGLKTAEVGVFEFNRPARSFFRSRGYRFAGRVPKRFWSEGRYWDDLRYAKDLSCGTQ